MTEIATILPDLMKVREIKPGSFVYQRKDALSQNDCANMIELFEEHTEEQTTGKVATGIYWPKLKKSTDIYLRGQEHWQWADDIFFNSIQENVALLAQQHPVFGEDLLDDWGYQIQKTSPGGHYHWHKDLNVHSRSRILVAIWYLNDVPEEHGGATEFLAQDIKVQPEAGKLILFPPYWTHVHRGCELTKGAKYIATTWVVYRGTDDTDANKEYPETYDGDLDDYGDG